jgi:hypothetical protein
MSTFATTAGLPIKCKAAVAWRPNEPLKTEEITVAPPKEGKVLHLRKNKDKLR